jgi:hypothetical protein
LFEVIGIALPQKERVERSRENGAGVLVDRPEVMCFSLIQLGNQRWVSHEVVGYGGKVDEEMFLGFFGRAFEDSRLARSGFAKNTK